MRKLSVVVVACLSCSLWSGVQAQTQRNYTIEENLVYARPGGEKLQLDAFLPKSAGPHPAVLVIHGGAWRMGSKTQLRVFAVKLAEQGYATFAIDYRLAPKHPFPAQIEDCRLAVAWIAENGEKYRVDPTRLGAFGYSAGGHLAALLAMEGVPVPAESSLTSGNSSDTNGQGREHSSVLRLKAVVAGGAPCDLRVLPAGSSALAYWLGGTRAEKPDAYKVASPITYVNAAASPIFFFHGEKDALVSPKLFGPGRMVEHLKRAGVESELYVVPKAGHILALLDSTAFQRASEFLDKHLKEGRMPKDE